MPTYKVVKPGFYNNQSYKPDGKRNILTLDKPLKKVPSWLEPVKDVVETPEQKKTRSRKQKADADKAQQDKIAKDAMFLDTPTHSVETL